MWDARTGDMLDLPIRGDGNEHFAVFSPDGLSLLAVDGSSLEILDMPPHGVPPSCVLELADFAATQNNYNQSRLPDLPKIHALRSRSFSVRLAVIRGRFLASGTSQTADGGRFRRGVRLAWKAMAAS